MSEAHSPTPAAFDTALDRVLRLEGGYVNDPTDRGGETRYGVTVATARRHGYTGAMADLPLQTAAAIYRAEYWNPLGLDDVAAWHPPLAEHLFDIAVNMGPGTAAGFLQRALNLMNRNQRAYADLGVDGRIGVATVAALRLLGEADKPLLQRVVGAYQARRYLEIIENDPTQERFTRGWFARLGSPPTEA
jgi:lysozyme family protein